MKKTLICLLIFWLLTVGLGAINLWLMTIPFGVLVILAIAVGLKYD